MAENQESGIYPIKELEQMKDINRKEDFNPNPQSTTTVNSSQINCELIDLSQSVTTNSTERAINFESKVMANTIQPNCVTHHQPINNYISNPMPTQFVMPTNPVINNSYYCPPIAQRLSLHNSEPRESGDGQTSNYRPQTGNTPKIMRRNPPKKTKFKLNSIAECDYLLPAFRPGFRPRPNQVFLFELPFDYRLGRNPNPYPDPRNRIDFWDDNHVKLPNSRHNQRKVPPGIISLNNYSTVNTWKMIENALSKKFTTFSDLEFAIRSYNNYENSINFDVLRDLLALKVINNNNNIYDILNNMSVLALKLPDIITQSPPLLRQKQNSTLFLSQKQIACLLANAFFCTFPRRSKVNDEYKDFPLVNFVTLFSSDNDPNKRKLKFEKLKSILNYFKCALNEKPTGIVTFERKLLKNSPNWSQSDKSLRKLQIEEKGSIENEGRLYTEVDFANRFIGGGVLKSGSLQEEIRFLISPELIVSKLFTEALLDNEALIVNGTVQFNKLDVNGTSFAFKGDARETPVKDTWGRNICQIVAIDSYEYKTNSQQQEQFNQSFIDRALNKAFVGFKDDYKYKNNKKPAIASGKWGCGGFNGDPYLSCVIQYMAASQAERDLILFVKNDAHLGEYLDILAELCYRKKLCVQDLYKVLVKYQNEVKSFNNKTNIVEFISTTFLQ